jgi:Ser/Thr protein kinase RdoA (MazF antagonist)
MTDVGVPSGGQRLPWAETPAPVRRAVQGYLGSPVLVAESQPGGFSPGLAARLLLADGRRVFVKAVGVERNPRTPELFRAEARVMAALPATVPAPRLLWTYDDGDWVALLLEDVDGRPPAQPWRPDELARVLDAVTALAATLTPAPIQAPAVAELLERQFASWRGLAAGQGAGALAASAPWAAANLDRLAGLEAHWPEGAAGPTLLHADLRADNLLLTPERVVFVDWPNACVGAAWVDLLLLLPSVALCGPPPDAVFDAHPLGRAAAPDAVDAVLAALAGYFVVVGRQPPPKGLPAVRALQRAQGKVTLAWLRRRLGQA